MNYRFSNKLKLLSICLLFCLINLHSREEEFFIENPCGFSDVIEFSNPIVWIDEDSKNDLFPKFASEIMESSFWNITDDRIRFVRFSSTITSNTLLQVSLGYKTNNANRRRIFQYDFRRTEEILSNSRYRQGNLMELMSSWETKDEPLFDLIFAINHELSHFGNGNILHTVDCSNGDGKLRIDQELSADKLATIKCFNMGITPVVNVYKILTNLKSSNNCYPKKEDRINLIRDTYVKHLKSISMEAQISNRYRSNSLIRDK